MNSTYEAGLLRECSELVPSRIKAGMRFISSINFRVSHIYFFLNNKATYTPTKPSFNFSTWFMPIPCIHGQASLDLYRARYFHFIAESNTHFSCLKILRFYKKKKKLEIPPLLELFGTLQHGQL